MTQRASTQALPTTNGSTPYPQTSNSTSRIKATYVPSANIDTHFATTTNLTTTVLGARILSSSDQWFAAASNLLTPTPPIHQPGKFTHAGAWYDGWETRRHNSKPFDWAVIKLGCVGVVCGVEVDTAFFNGNEAPEVELEGCFLGKDEDGSGVDGEDFTGWETILPRQECGPSMRQAWALEGEGVAGREYTHVRLKMFPDGGIARLRVFGGAVPPPLSSLVNSFEDWPSEEVSSALNGGVAVAWSDQHFGVGSNILLPGRGVNMGDGWETKRSRTKGHVDWVVVRLGLNAGGIEKVVIDTKDFRGNFPRAVRVDGYLKSPSDNSAEDPKFDNERWLPLFEGERPCKADFEHVFEGADLIKHDMSGNKFWTHAKVTIIPDGGIKRFRIFGKRD